MNRRDWLKRSIAICAVMLFCLAGYLFFSSAFREATGLIIALAGIAIVEILFGRREQIVVIWSLFVFAAIVLGRQGVLALLTAEAVLLMEPFLFDKGEPQQKNLRMITSYHALTALFALLAFELKEDKESFTVLFGVFTLLRLVSWPLQPVGETNTAETRTRGLLMASVTPVIMCIQFHSSFSEWWWILASAFSLFCLINRNTRGAGVLLSLGFASASTLGAGLLPAALALQAAGRLGETVCIAFVIAQLVFVKLNVPYEVQFGLAGVISLLASWAHAKARLLDFQNLRRELALVLIAIISVISTLVYVWDDLLNKILMPEVLAFFALAAIVETVLRKVPWLESIRNIKARNLATVRCAEGLKIFEVQSVTQKGELSEDAVWLNYNNGWFGRIQENFMITMVGLVFFFWGVWLWQR